MSAPLKIRDWWTQVRNELLPESHGHQVNALAELSFAMVMAEHCQAGKISTLAPGRGPIGEVSNAGSRGAGPTTGSTPMRPGPNWPAPSSPGGPAGRSS